MKDISIDILNKYINLFPDEKERLKLLSDFLERNTDESVCDWNNFDGHIVASGIIYSKKEQQFLVMFHNDFKMFLYPGGHTTFEDKDPLTTAKREVEEETGLKKLDLVSLTRDPLVPFDIDIHFLKPNLRLNLPEHMHFDFRYFFAIDKITNIVLDEDELSDYKWISREQFFERPQYKRFEYKVDKLISILEQDRDIDD